MRHFEQEVAPRVGEPQTSDFNQIDNLTDRKAVTLSRRVAVQLSSALFPPQHIGGRL